MLHKNRTRTCLLKCQRAKLGALSYGDSRCDFMKYTRNPVDYETEDDISVEFQGKRRQIVMGHNRSKNYNLLIPYIYGTRRRNT